MLCALSRWSQRHLRAYVIIVFLLRLFCQFDDGEKAWARSGLGLRISHVGMPVLSTRQAEMMLDAIGLKVDVLIIGAECARAKPHPDPYQVY
jgi:hypothetical protein